MKKKQIMEEYIARNGSVKPDEVEVREQLGHVWSSHILAPS